MGKAPTEDEGFVAAKLILFIKWEECAAHVAAKLIFFNQLKTVASGLGRAASCVELVGKNGDGWSRRLPGKMCRHKKVYIEALERLIEPEDEEVCPRYILKYSTRAF